MRPKLTKYESRLLAAAIEPYATTAPHLCLVKREDVLLLLRRCERLTQRLHESDGGGNKKARTY